MNYRTVSNGDQGTAVYIGGFYLGQVLKAPTGWLAEDANQKYVGGSVPTDYQGAINRLLEVV